jgi:hypothetical protein
MVLDLIYAAHHKAFQGAVRRPCSSFFALSYGSYDWVVGCYKYPSKESHDNPVRPLQSTIVSLKGIVMAVLLHSLIIE